MFNIVNYQIIGLIAAVLVMIAIIPRYWNLLTTRHLNGISLIQLFLLVIGCVLWIMYGVRDSSPPVVLLATFCLAITCILFVIKLRSKE